MCFHFFYTVQVDTVYQKDFCNSCLFLFFLFLRWNSENKKNIFCTSEASLCFTQKNNFCIINKTNLVRFYSLHANYFFEQKRDLFIYFKNIFHHVTLKNIFRILNNYVYFQDIVVRNEPFRSSSIIFRSTHRRYPIQKSALKYFATFTVKNLWWSLFFNKIVD